MATATPNKPAQKPAQQGQPAAATIGTKNNPLSAGEATTQKTTVSKEQIMPAQPHDEADTASNESITTPIALEFIDEQLPQLPTGKYKLRPLSKTEMEELEDHENTLRKGLPVFLVVAQALYEIQRKQLWRLYCRSFAEYCEKRLKISRTFAYMQAAAAEVMQNLSTSGEQFPLPTTERQLRSMAGLESAVQVEVWKLALEKAGESKVTGKLVEECVQEVLGDGSSPADWMTRTRQKLATAGYEADFDQPVTLSNKEWIDFIQEEGSDAYVKLIDQLTLSNMGICLAMKELTVKCQVIINGDGMRKGKLEMQKGLPTRLLDPVASVFIHSLGAFVEYDGRLYEGDGLNKDFVLKLKASDSDEANDLRLALAPQQQAEEAVAE